MAISSPVVFETHIKSLPRLHRGKVRDVYAIDADSLLIITTDRLSAFDVVLPDPIPGKGQVLNRISNFWFARTGHIVPNHLIDRPLAEVLPDPAERAEARLGGHAGLGLDVVLVAKERAQGDAHRTQEGPQRATDQFAGPLHACEPRGP